MYMGAGCGGWVVKATPPPLYPRESDPLYVVPEAGWASWPVWTGAENLAFLLPARRPARLESQYGIKCVGFVRKIHDGVFEVSADPVTTVRPHLLLRYLLPGLCPDMAPSRVPDHGLCSSSVRVWSRQRRPTK